MSFWIVRVVTPNVRASTGMVVARRATSMRMISALRSFIVTVDYPLETKQGNGGCVKVADWYHPHRNLLSEEQQRTLSQLMESATEQQAEVLREMLVEYGSPKYRQMYEEDRNVRNITRVSH